LEFLSARLVGDAIRNFLAYLTKIERGVFPHFARDGQASLAIGLAFILARGSAATLLRALSESLIAAGWVGMWRPIQMLLYDGWSIRRHIAVFERLASIEIDVAPAAEAESP
jgi:hypothetical protein